MGKILIADDEKRIRELLVSILESEGHEMIIAKNGEEVLDKFNDKVDLVITDILMPEKEGMEVIRKLKEDKEEIQTIAISGGGKIGPERYLRLAKKLGADEKIKKPFGPEEIINCVDKLLD